MLFENDIRHGCREERRELDETRLRRGSDCKEERREERIPPHIQLERNSPCAHLGILYPKNSHWSLHCERVDTPKLILAPHILGAYVLFVEGHLPKHGGAPATATSRPLRCLLNCDVLGL
jgi:hypothetical protein